MVKQIYIHNEMDIFFSLQLHNITTKVKYITIIVYPCLLLFDYYNWSWLFIQIFRYHTNEFTFPTSDPIFDIKKDFSFQYCITSTISMIIKLDPSLILYILLLKGGNIAAVNSSIGEGTILDRLKSSFPSPISNSSERSL